MTAPREPQPPEYKPPRGYTAFSDKTIWGWCREVARIAQQRPDQHPEQIADEVLAELQIVNLELDGEL